MYAEFRTNQGIQRGLVIKNNSKTMIIKLKDGTLIKRHKDKHGVLISEDQTPPEKEE
jgi:hypothetical protein